MARALRRVPNVDRVRALLRGDADETERVSRGHPTQAREHHSDFEVLNGTIGPDANGGYGYPTRRAVDCLDVMLKRGTIDQSCRDAGARFRDDFGQAHLEPLKASDPAAIRVQMTRLTDSRGNPARDRVWEALLLLGGLNSPAGSCAWHVLGEQQNIKDWQVLHGFAKNRQAASGILVATLGVLVAHYGLTPS